MEETEGGDQGWEPCPERGPLNLLRERDKGSVAHSI